MFKRLFIFFLFFLLTFSLLFAFFYFKNLQKNKDQEIPKKETPLQKEVGEKTISQAIPLDNNTYIVEQGPRQETSSNPSFIIYFYQDTGEYNITLLKNPIEETRKDAEQAFAERLLKLGLKKEDACSLFVTVDTIASVNADLAGRNLGLSFCKK